MTKEIVFLIALSISIVWTIVASVLYWRACKLIKKQDKRAMLIADIPQGPYPTSELVLGETKRNVHQMRRRA